LDDRPATVSGHPFEDEPLILGGLIVAAHPQIDRRANAIGVQGPASQDMELYRNDTIERDFVEL
jgi:hypothetical protein